MSAECSAGNIPPGYKQTEVGVIPEDWEVASIDSLASFVSGNGISVAELRRQSPDNPIPVYGGNGIAGYTSIPLVKEQTVIVGRVGQKCGEVYLSEGPAWITDNALYPRTIFRKLDIRFLALALKAARLNDLKNRNDLPLVTQSILHSVHISIPSTLAEQEAIVEALSDTDALIESLEQLIVKKRQIKQGAMQELLTGKRRLAGFEGEWETKLLEDVFIIFSGTSKSRYVTKCGIYCIADMGSVSIEGKLISSKHTDYYGDFLVRGDLIMPKDDIGGGNIIGKVAYIDSNDHYVLGDHLYVLRSRKGDSMFFSYIINGYEINSALRKKVSGSAQLGLARKAVEEQEIPFPTIDEQQAIATILSDMDSEITVLEEKLSKARQLKQGMMQELLTGRVRLI